MLDQAKVQSKTKSQNQSWWNNAYLPFPFNNRGEVVATPEKFKIKVDGQDVEVTKDEMIELAQKGKDYTKKTQELATQEKALKDEQERVKGLKSIVDEMEADPRLKETLNKVYTDFKSGKISKSDDTKDRNLKKIDKLIEDASEPGEREKLRDIREIIKQEAPDNKALEDKVAKLENELSTIREAALIGQSDRTEVQVEKLKEDYGDELVNKHKEEVKALALKYPRQSVENLLLHLADKSQVRTALLNQAKKKDKEELDRKKRGSSASGTETSFTAKTPLTKDKRTGRTTMESLLQRVKERLGRA